MGRVFEGLSAALRRGLLLGPHTCPWWFGYSFDNPLRRLVHDPARILGPLVSPGERALDIGCGLGYFSLGLARLVGEKGSVVAVDLQPQMISRAKRRAGRRGLADRIAFRVCDSDRLGVERPFDLVLAFWVVHEVASPDRLLAEVLSLLAPGARLLIVEPKGHVSSARFEDIVRRAQAAGFLVAEGPAVRFSRSILCSPGGQGSQRPTC